MLKRRSPSRGFTLIELMVTITLVGILLVVGVPTFLTWGADSKVRTTAEALLSALRLTQASAVSRSRVGAFELTNDTPVVYSSTPVANGTNWFIALQVLPNSDETAAGLDTVQKATVAHQNGTSITGSAVTCFNNFGQLTSGTVNGVSCAAPTGTVTYAVSSSKAVRKYNVVVAPGGQIRMCDALKTLSTTNPDGC